MRSSVSRRPGYGRVAPDSRVQQVTVRAERLQVERARDVHRVEQRHGVVEREGRPPGGERVLIQQRDRLSLCRLELVEQPCREIRSGREVTLADGAESSDLGEPVLVQPHHDVRGELGPGRRHPLGKRVGKPKHRRADDVMRRSRSLCDQVLTHEEPVVARVGDRERLAHADTGRDAVGGPAGRQVLLDDGPRRRHAFERLRRELDWNTFARDGDDILEPQVVPVRTTVTYRSLPTGAVEEQECG